MSYRSLQSVGATYGLTEEAVHETLISRRSVRALCAAIDAMILRGDLDSRSYVADARLALAEIEGFEVATEPEELARRVAFSRPGEERAALARRFGEDDFR